MKKQIKTKRKPPVTTIKKKSRYGSTVYVYHKFDWENQA